MTKIDYTKPIITSDAEPDAVTVIAELPDGSAVVTIKNRNSPWFVFNSEGRFVTSSNGCGRAITLKNVPETSKVFLRLSTFNGDVSLHRTPPMGTGVAVMEVTLENGIVVDVNLAHANELPFKKVRFLHEGNLSDV